MRTCKYFERCGGCTNLDIPYDEQLESKSKLVEKEFNNNSIKTRERTSTAGLLISVILCGKI